MSDQTEDTATPTVRDRLRHLSDERVEGHRAAGRIRLNGERVDDLSLPAAPPARVTLAGS
jgi:hypothetical protein